MGATAYVSYSWTVEKNSLVVAEIQRLCLERKVDLALDKERVIYGDSIPNFMRRIGEARWVFVVLSPEYLKSPYCMFELLKIFEFSKFDPTQLDRRVLPILVEREWLDDAQRNALLAVVGDYWKAAAEAELEQALAQTQKGNAQIALDQQQRALFVSEVRRRLPEFIGYFGDKALPAVLPLPSVHLQALVERIPIHRSLKDDADFAADIQARITSLLTGAKPSLHFQNVLANSIWAGECSVENLAEQLTTSPEEAIDQILTPLYIRLRQELGRNSAEFLSLWEDAKELLGCILLLAVRQEWLECSGLDPATDSQFEIAVRTAFGVEIVSARLRQVAKLKLEASAGKPDVNGAHRILPPWNLPSGWGNGSDSNPVLLRRSMIAVWNKVFPEEAKSDLNGLTDLELEILNGALRKRERSKTHHYYLQVNLSLSEPNSCARALCAELASKLSALPIIYMGAVRGGVAIFSAPEVGLLNSARDFLQIPHQD